MQPSLFIRIHNKIETVGNRLPQPFIIFIGLAVLTIFISALCQLLGVSAQLQSIEQGQALSKTIVVNSLLDKEGILFILSSVISNFTGFFPLGTVFFMMLGVGLAEKSGLIRALLYYLVAYTPKRMITATVVFLGVFSSVASSAGYVVLVPLGAIIFLGFNRHPIAGLAAAFAGVSGGWSANILLGTNDAIFAGISTEAAHLLDPHYLVAPTSNWYFMAVSAFLITGIGTWVTDKIVEPRLGAYHGTHETLSPLSKNELKALKWTGIVFIIYTALIIMAALPTDSLLRNPETHAFAGSPLLKNLIIFIGLSFFIVGITFGIGAKTISNTKAVADIMEQSIAQLAGFLVLIFFAAQFIAYFNYSNLGIILAIKGAQFLQNLGLTGLLLVISLVILTAFLDLLIAVDSAKWAIMAPIFVPMFMLLGLSPELTQAAYRIGDSVTNIIAPTMPFFALIVAFCQKYDAKVGIGSLVSIMLPYSLAFLVGWILLLAFWFLMGFHLGPDAPLFYLK